MLWQDTPEVPDIFLFQEAILLAAEIVLPKVVYKLISLEDFHS